MNSQLIDKALESKMEKAQIVSSLVLSLRKKEMIKVRQPLQKIMIPVLDDKQREEIKAVEDLIKAEVNVKEIDLLSDTSDILVKQIKPNFKTLGPKFGKQMGAVAKEIQAFSQEQIQTIEKDGSIEILLNDSPVTLSIDEVEISSQDIEGWTVANSKDITVALDITITESLKNEGIARELVNRIQNIRKDLGFEVTDTITVEMEKQPQLEKAVEDNLEYIKNETLAKELLFVDSVENGINIDIEDMKTKVAISPNTK